MPEGKLAIDVGVVHPEDGVIGRDGGLGHVADVFVEAAGPVVDVIVDILQVEVGGW